MAYNFDFSPINHYQNSRDLISGPRTTHCADFRVTDKGREYWGTVYRLFDRTSGACNRVSFEVSLRTMNSRTGWGACLPENAKAALRAAAVATFKHLLSDWVDGGQPSTFEQRKAKLAKAEAREAVATYQALAEQLGDPRHLENAREHLEVLEDPRGVFDLEATQCAIEQVRDLLESEADFRQRKQLIADFEPRAAQLLAAKRAVYGDRFATAAEAEMQAEDPLAWLELIGDQLTAETGLTYRGSWATESEIQSATAAAAAEDLDKQAGRARLFSAMTAPEAEQLPPPPAEICLPEIAERDRCPDQAPACSAPDLEAEALYREIREAQISDLIKAGREALFALEGIALLQGNREVLAYASRLGRALSPFAEGAAA